MKRLYEGASIVSVILLVIVSVSAMFFSVKGKKDEHRHKKHAERKLIKEKLQEEKNHLHLLDRSEMEKAKLEAEVEELRKMNDPLWHYYDVDTDSMVTIPGKYKEDIPRR